MKHSEVIHMHYQIATKRHSYFIQIKRNNNYLNLLRSFFYFQRVVLCFISRN